MASGCERSVSIFILLRLVIHRRKPVEDEIKREKKGRRREKKHIPTFVFLFTFSASQNCFDVIWFKVIWVCDCEYLCVFHWFQRQPQGTDVSSPNPDIKGFEEFWPPHGSTQHSLDCQCKCNVGFNIGASSHYFIIIFLDLRRCGQVEA